MDYFFQEFKGGMVGWMRPVVFLVITAGVEIATCKSAQLDSYENLCSLLFSACYTGPVCKIERKIKERFFKEKTTYFFFFFKVMWPLLLYLRCEHRIQLGNWVLLADHSVEGINWPIECFPLGWTLDFLSGIISEYGNVVSNI